AVVGAITARELATQLRWSDPENELVAGLLRDLGILVLLEVFPEQYSQVCASPPEMFLFQQCELESRILGVNHAEVSAYLLRRWRLPEDLSEAIRHHHLPSAAPSQPPQVMDRAYLLYFSTLIGQLQLTPDQLALREEIIRLAGLRFGMND